MLIMQTKNKQLTGFTIVELLIVIVVIGILAAITIVAYSGIQTRAVKTTAHTDVSNFMRSIEVAKANTSDGNYPLTPTASMGIRAVKSSYLVNRNNWYYCTNDDRTEYALGVAVAGHTGGSGFIASSLNGIQETTGVDDAKTCGVIGKLNGSRMGHTWNGATGTWSSWING